nr:T9SS type A sorting domain-containing protein [Bacteroidota bacterium]
LEVEYDVALPNTGIFSAQGLSAVKSLKLQSLDVAENTNITIEVYPNPSNGNFNLTMSTWPEKMQVHLMDTKGRILEVFAPGEKLNGSSYAFNLTDLPNGVYFLKLVDSGIIEIKKIVIN